MGFKVLFVGVGNSCRTPMAEGFARKLGLRAQSAGTMPGRVVTPAAVAAMNERGIDISNHRPKRLEYNDLPEFDRLIYVGDGVTRTVPELARQAHETWDLPDIVGQPLQSYREIRDKIERRVHKMVDELNEWQRA